MKNCDNCAYHVLGRCLVFKEKLKNCFAWADDEEARKRELAIKKYSGVLEPTKNAPVRQKLQRHFMELYKQGKTDAEIAMRLKVSATSVANYRYELGLKSHYAKKITALLQQERSSKIY